MKHTFLSLSTGLALAGLSTSAQAVTVFIEDFEDADYTSTYGNGYSQSHADASDSMVSSGADYFGRVDPVDGISIVTNETFLNVQGTGFFAGQDIDSNNNAGIDPNISTSATLNWTGINITNYTNLGFSIYFAEASDGNNWDGEESIIISYQIDGGGFNNFLAAESSSASTNQTQAGIDRDLNGVADGVVTNEVAMTNEPFNNTFTQFSQAIAGTGSSLDLTITIVDGGFTRGSEDFAFDNVEITGDLVPEPSSTSLLGLGGLALLLRRRR